MVYNVSSHSIYWTDDSFDFLLINPWIESFKFECYLVYEFLSFSLYKNLKSNPKP